MSEKKIFSIDVAMDEPMFNAVKGIAEADGVSAPDLIRMLCSTLISEREAYYALLHSIFGKDERLIKQKQTGSPPE